MTTLNDPAPQPLDWSGERGKQWAQTVDAMEAMLVPVDAPLLQALDLSEPVRIADLGCGGGGTARAALSAAPAGSSVHGFDVSPDLIEAARSRADDASLRFEVADLENAPAPAEPFDRLFSRFGLMFFADPSSTFARLADGWLREGGRLATATWAAPQENAWAHVVREVVSSVVPVPAPPPDSPGPFRYAEPDALPRLLTGAGFKAVRRETWRGVVRPGGGLCPDEASRFALSAFASFTQLLRDAGPDATEAAHRKLSERLTSFLVDGQVVLPAAAHIVTAVR